MGRSPVEQRLIDALRATLRPTDPAGWDWPHVIRLELNNGKSFEVALNLYERGRLGIRGLGDFIISRAAARLQEAGLIEKAAHPTDRRLVALSLTAQGQDLMTRILPRARAFEAELDACLGAAESRALRAALVRLLDRETP